MENEGNREAVTPKRVRTKVEGVVERGHIETSREVRQGGKVIESVESASKEMREEAPCGDPAYVSVTGGMTKNMGDYNSIRVSVTVTRPCANTDDDIRRCKQETADLVDEFLDEEFRAATGRDE